MSEQTPLPPGSPQDPTIPASTPPAGGVPSGPAAGRAVAASPPPKRKRRRWIWISLLIIVVLLGGLVLLAPTIAGSSPVISAILGPVNKQYLNGRLTVDSVSLGWFSGVKIEGVKLFDDQNAEVASVGQITTPLTVLDVVRGKFDLGDAYVKGVRFDAKVVKGADGKPTTNFQQLLKPVPPSEKPAKLPDLKGKLHLEDVSGKVQDTIRPQTTSVDALPGEVDVADINQPIDFNFDATLGYNGKPAGKTKLVGSVGAIANNYVAMDKLTAALTVAMEQLDLAAAGPIVTLAGQDLTLAGVAGGGIKADVKSITDIAATGQPTLTGFSVTGGPLKQDSLAYKTIAIPLTASVKGEGAQTMIALDLGVQADGDTISVKVNGPQGVLQAVPTILQQVAAKLSGKVIPASTEPSAVAATATTGPSSGRATAVVTAKLDAARLVSQLPHVLMLKPGTALSSGQLSADVNLDADASSAKVVAGTTVTNVKGTQDGKPIALGDIVTSLNATALGGAAPTVKDVALKITSPFLTADGGGATLANTQFKGGFDLQRLQQQLGQIVDFDAMFHAPAGSHVQLAGTGAFAAGSTGDLTSPDGVIAAKANLTLSNLKVTGIGKTQPISQDQIVVDAGADVHRAADGQSLQGLQNVAVKFTAPSATVQLAADVTKRADGSFVAPRFEIPACRVDLAKLVHDFRPLLAMATQASTTQPAAPSLMKSLADGSVVIGSGVLTAGVKGSYDGTNFTLGKPIEAHVTNLELSQTDAYGDTTTARQQAIDVTATVDPTAAGGTIKNLKVVIGIGPAAARILDLTLGADVILAASPTTRPADGSAAVAAAVPSTAPAGKTSVPRFEVALAADLAKLQSDLGPALAMVAPPAPTTQPADAAAAPSLMQAIAADLISVTTGTVTLNAAGSYDGTTAALSKPATFDLKNLHVVKRPPGGAPEDVLTLADAAGTATVTPTNGSTVIAADVKATGISAQQYLHNETLQLTPRATINSDYTVVTDTGLKLTSSFAGIDASNISLNLAATDPLDKLKSGRIVVTNADLAKLYALASAFKAPAPVATKAAEAQTPAAAATPPLPDLEIPSGMASLTLDVNHDGNSTKLDVSNCAVSNLSVRRGTSTFAFPKDVTVDVKAVATGTGSKIGQLTVSALNASLGVCQIGLADGKALTVTNADDTKQMAADGAFLITGQGPATCRLVEVLTGKAKGAYPYAGKYTITEAISKAAGSGVAMLKGGINVEGLRVLSSIDAAPAAAAAPGTAATAGGPQVLFAEDQFVVSNNLKADLDAHDLTMDANDPVTVVMKSSGAMGLKLWGTVNDWAAKRNVDVQADADYDLAKLWPVVKPFVVTTPDSALKDMTIEGAFKKHFFVKGSVPADVAFAQAVKGLKAGGALAVGKLNAVGLAIANLEVPFTLADGMIHNVYPDGANAGQYAPAASCNGGTIDLGHLQVDMTQTTPTLTMLDATEDKPYPLLQKVSLNQVLAAKGLGDFINNPAFANADSASGVVRMVVLTCKDLPLGELAKQAVPENKGVLKLRYTVEGITLGNDNLTKLLDLVHGNEKSVNGEIRGATVTIQNGVTTTDTAISLRNGSIPLRFAGGVNMANQSIVPGFTVDLPMAGFVGDKSVAQYLPDSVPVGLSGFIKSPQINAGNVISNAFAGAARKAALGNVGNLLGGNKKGDGAAPNGNAPAANPVGDLLNGVLGGEKKGAAAAPAAQPSASPSAAPAATQPAAANNNPIGQILGGLTGDQKSAAAGTPSTQPANDNPIGDLFNAIGGDKKKKK